MGKVNTSIITPFSIVDGDISRSAAISSSTMQHSYVRYSTQGIAIGSTPTTKEEIVHVASGVGTVTGFHAMLNACGSSSSMTVDLKKNGTTMLSSVITLTNATGNRTEVDATLASTAITTGDVLSVSWTVSSSTGAQGPVARLSIIENTSPA